MITDMQAIDADAHVYEDPFLLSKRAPKHLVSQLPQEYGRTLGYRFGNQIAHSSATRWAAFEAGGWEAVQKQVDAESGGPHSWSMRVTHDLFPGAAIMSDGSPWHTRFPELPEHYDDKWYQVGTVRKYLKQEGFDYAFMYPSLGLYLPCFDGMGALGIETCKVYNDWLLDFCKSSEGTLMPVGMIALHVVDLAIQEVRRIKELGFKGIVLSRFPDGRTSADSDLEPFWQACEDCDLVVSFHPVTSNTYLSDPPLPRPLSPFEFFNLNLFGQHFANLLLSGVLERHPRLKIALLESGCSWLPGVLWRLDRYFWQPQLTKGVWEEEITRLLAGLSRDELAANVRMSPVDYFRRQCYIACEAEPFVPDVANLIGEDRITFQGDFPHPDHHPRYVAEFASIVPSGLRQKILWDNPVQMYRWTP